MRRPLAISFLFFLAGICFAAKGSPFLFAVVFGLLLAGYGLARAWQRIPRRWGVFLLVLLVGFFYTEARTEEASAAWEKDAYLTIEGTVCDFPQEDKEKCRFLLKADSAEGRLGTAKLLVLAEPDTAVCYGDRVRVYGKVLEVSSPQNPGAFDYEEYMENTDISATLSALYDGSCLVTGEGQVSPLMSAAAACRGYVVGFLSALPQDWGAVLKGVFLGDTSGLSQGVSDALTKSGVRHCFSVSGLHVGYLVLLVGWLLPLVGVPRNKGIFILLPLLAFYAAVTGLQPAVIRASVMCAVLYFSLFCGRQGDGYTAIALAGYLLLLWDPRTLWLLSFELSFGAMLGIIYFTPFLRRVIRWDFPGKTAALVTLAAEIAVIPLTAYHFHVVSLVSVFINTLACLVTGGMVLLCFVGLLLSPIFGTLFFSAAGFLSQGFLWGLNMATALPLAYFYCDAFPLWALLLVGALLLLIPKIPWLRFRPLLSAAAVFCVLLLLVVPFPAFTKQPMEVTFLSVGEGDCIYLSTPHGERILIDAGGDEKAALYSIRPFLLERGVNTLDAVFLSHSDSDHAGSLPFLLDFFPAEELILTQASYYYSSRLEEEAESREVAVVKVAAGDRAVYDGVEFQVLAPKAEDKGSGNELSMVLKVTYGEVSLLFTGDAATEGLEALAATDEALHADVLKIPHHGSKTGYSTAFYEKAAPAAVVISVGENDFGHPDDMVTQYWRERGIPCYRTDRDGAVTVLTDGVTYEVTTYLR